MREIIENLLASQTRETMCQLNGWRAYEILKQYHLYSWKYEEVEKVLSELLPKEDFDEVTHQLKRYLRANGIAVG